MCVCVCVCVCVCGGGSARVADFEAKIRDVNSFSGENLHDFEIISPARGCERTTAPPCVRVCI